MNQDLHFFINIIRDRIDEVTGQSEECQNYKKDKFLALKRRFRRLAFGCMRKEMQMKLKIIKSWENCNCWHINKKFENFFVILRTKSKKFRDFLKNPMDPRNGSGSVRIRHFLRIRILLVKKARIRIRATLLKRHLKMVHVTLMWGCRWEYPKYSPNIVFELAYWSRYIESE